MKDANEISRKHTVFAALMGAVLLSGCILDKKSGLKLAYDTGFKFPARIFATEEFKRSEPAVTMVVREACSRGQDASGWVATSFQDAQRPPGRAAGLVLKGKTENVRVGGKKAQLLTGDDFVAWVAKKYILAENSAWIKASK